MGNNRKNSRSKLAGTALAVIVTILSVVNIERSTRQSVDSSAIAGQDIEFLPPSNLSSLDLTVNPEKQDHNASSVDQSQADDLNRDNDIEIQAKSNESIIVGQERGNDQSTPLPLSYQERYESNPYVRQMIENRHACLRHVRARHDHVFDEEILNRDRNDAEVESVLLVDPSYHPNVGDSMLTQSEQQYFRETKRLVVPECGYIQTHKRVPKCSPHFLENALINRNGTETPTKKHRRIAFWHAGGNWGDLYVFVHRKRIKSLGELLSHGFDHVVSMPQSFHYKNDELKHEHVSEIRSSLLRGLNSTSSGAAALRLLEDPSNTTNTELQWNELLQKYVTLTWREKYSFDQAQILYPFVSNRLVPDIAFQLGPFAPLRSTAAVRKISNSSAPSYLGAQQIQQQTNDMVDILLFLRTDPESSVSMIRKPEIIKKMLRKVDNATEKNIDSISFLIVDWKDRMERFGIEKEDYFSNSSVRLMSLGKVVVADRLHAAILTYLTGLPLVYLDQATQKLTKTLGTALNSSAMCQDGHAAMYQRATSIEDALHKAVAMLDKYDLR